jgi:hypothetical protein
MRGRERTELCAEAAALSLASCSYNLASSEGIGAETEGSGGIGVEIPTWGTQRVSAWL